MRNIKIAVKTGVINKKPKNKGKLLMDATYVKYPTDLNLLDEDKRKPEKMIDEGYI